MFLAINKNNFATWWITNVWSWLILYKSCQKIFNISIILNLKVYLFHPWVAKKIFFHGKLMFIEKNTKEESVWFYLNSSQKLSKMKYDFVVREFLVWISLCFCAFWNKIRPQKPQNNDFAPQIMILAWAQIEPNRLFFSLWSKQKICIWNWRKSRVNSQR